MSFIGSVVMRSASLALKGAKGIGTTAISGGLVGRMALGAGTGALGGWFSSSDQYDFGHRVDETLRGALLGATVGGVAHAGLRGARAISTRATAARLIPDRHLAVQALTQKWKVGPDKILDTFPEKFLAKKTAEMRTLSATQRLNLADPAVVARIKSKITVTDRLKTVGLNATKLGFQAVRVTPGLTRAGLSAGAWALAHPKTVIAGAAGAAYAYSSLTSNAYGTSPTLNGAQVRTDYDNQALAAEHMSMGLAPMGAVMPANRGRFENSTQGLVQGLHRGRH